MGERGRMIDAPVAEADRRVDALETLLDLPSRGREEHDCRIDGVVEGTLVGFDTLQHPLITYPGQPGTAALRAKSVVDLHPDHLGQPVLLAFERGDPMRPFVTGRSRHPSPWPEVRRPLQVDVEADGERVTVTAGEQLVLRCGKASITLTASGKVLIEGAYVSSRSSGVLRLKGGSVQLN